MSAHALLAAHIEVRADWLRVDVVVTPECSPPLCDSERLCVDLLVDKPLSTETADSEVVVSETTTLTLVEVEQEGGWPEIDCRHVIVRQRACGC